jgi:hypothetical protein
LGNPELLKSIGASWRLLFFLLLQVDITSKSFTSQLQPLAEALGVTISTLSSWIQRLQALKVISVKSIEEKVKLGLLPPFSKIILVTEEIVDPTQEGETRKEFDESTTDLILRRRSRALHKVEEDIDFIFNKLLSIDLRLSALERVYQESHHPHNKSK